MIERVAKAPASETWAAQDIATQELVQIFLLKDGNSERVERLLREAQALSLLRHPNLRHVLGAGLPHEAIPLPFVAIDAVQGTEIARHARLQLACVKVEAWLRRMVGLFIQAFRAFATLHGWGIAPVRIREDEIVVSSDGRTVVATLGLLDESRGTPSENMAQLGGIFEDVLGALIRGTPLESVVAALIHPDPNHRFRSIEEVARRLEYWLRVTLMA